MATVVAVRRMLGGRPVGGLVERAPAGAADATPEIGAHGMPRPSATRPDDDPARTARLVGRWRAAVDRALAALPGDRGCLVRATALHRHLRAAGLDAVVRIGVRRTGDALDAHAWVEVDGAPIGEPADHVAAFAPLDGITLR